MPMDLRVEAPELEPSPVLLAQLSQLSAHSVATAPAGGSRITRTLMAAASVTVLAGVSWLTGTMPGVASPFSRGPEHGHAQHRPAEPSSDAAEESAVPFVPETRPPAVPPGQAKPHHDNGHHNGQTKPHQDNGHHNGQASPDDTGDDTGQSGSHDNGNHNGQTKPHDINGNPNGQSSTAGTSQGNGHGT